MDTATCPSSTCISTKKCSKAPTRGQVAEVQGTKELCLGGSQINPVESFSTTNLDRLFSIFTNPPNERSLHTNSPVGRGRAVIPSHSPLPSPPSSPLSAPTPATILTANSSQPQSQSPNTLFSLNHCNLDSISFDDIFKLHAPTLRSVPAGFIQDYGHLFMKEL